LWLDKSIHSWAGGGWGVATGWTRTKITNYSFVITGFSLRKWPVVCKHELFLELTDRFWLNLISEASTKNRRDSSHFRVGQTLLCNGKCVRKPTCVSVLISNVTR
jgi:hypothetical protein